MITAFYRLVDLSDEVKVKNGIKVGAKIPRYDCIAYSGDYDGIKPFVNHKGMFKLSLMDTKEFVNADKRRMAEFALVGGKNLNFSSMYFGDPINGNVAYGYANGRPYLKDGRINPVFSFRQDLYLFIIDDAFTQIEILVLKNQKGFANELLQAILDGDFDAEVDNLRAGAKIFYNYA